MQLPKRVHLIAVGGSVMHNLALALYNMGVVVTGSDDEFYEPSLSRLKAAKILPDNKGWDDSRISKDVEAVILGMHAKSDNPELVKAKELEIPIYSFPEFVYLFSQDKQRIVIAGSHGKTTITSMILHVLNYWKKEFDFLVGAQIEGFDTMVRLSDAPILIVEGDEYLNSSLDPVPKFFKYHHHIALISGVAWDHINVFPTFEGYLEQFKKLAQATPKAGVLICNGEDKITKDILETTEFKSDQAKLEYTTHPHIIENGKPYLTTGDKKYPVQFFGNHNFSNVSAAKVICSRIRITDEQFYEAIQFFKGASKRLELVNEAKTAAFYKDFAHSPSKLKASSSSLKELYPNRKLVACMELHTFSSTKKEFLALYKDTFNTPDLACVFINPKVFENKGVPVFTESEIKAGFGREDIHVFTNSEDLITFLQSQKWDNTNLIMMSSANFDNLDFKKLAKDIL